MGNDNDVHASVTYRKNHPGVEFVLGDISASEIKRKIVRAIKAETGMNTVDVIIGGPPCKGFSLTNKMTRNMKNPMNRLVMDYVAMIKKLKPKAFVMENVPGIFAMEG